MAQVGRISGPLLKANLERQGIDLAFSNTFSDTELLYLDVNNGRIAVNSNTPSRDLDILGTKISINLAATTSLTSADVEFFDNTIRVLSGDINLDANDAIIIPRLETSNLDINDNDISILTQDTSIEFTPNGAGTTEIVNDLNVLGNLHATGDLTFDGSIVLGSSLEEDTVDFNAEVTTNIIPSENNTYSLGTFDTRWNALYTNFVNGKSVSVDELQAGLIDFNLRHAGKLYVSIEGNDTNVGDHPQGPLQTISEALSRAESSGEQPVLIFVSPGEYQEALPLVLPSNVSIVGTDIRNVIITPDTSSQSEDVFHLDDSCTISNLTVRNHYYDSINNTGYAFRFKPNAIISNRSPYIQNVTVLTQETSEGAGDAGRGAWVDGNELDAATVQKSMLFHSCTFISPNADVINMTNDVRVEWLNSFTYYANRGLYAFAGVSGGAELRSIGSASVYGTYGAVADGADTLMYLIQHNFAYIGAGTKNDNNLLDVIQENEVVELNSGQIHYVSTDQYGNFRVGNNFFIDLETGNTSIDIGSLDVSSLSGLVITDDQGTTNISGSSVTTGNLLIDGNNISTATEDLNISGASNTINLNDNTSISGNLDIRDNFTFDGTLNIAGNEPGRITPNDKIVFNVEIEQDFKPHRTLVHSLGEIQRYWYDAFIDRLESGNITFDENYVTTDISNADLELRANGIGKIYLESNNFHINNNLSVTGVTTVKNLDFVGAVGFVGDKTQVGDFTTTNLNISQNLTTGSQALFEEILFDGNVITTTTSNSDLEFRANGTGKILIPNNNVNISNNLQSDTINSDRIFISQTTEFNNAFVSETQITQNYITSTDINADLILRANQLGIISILNNNVKIENNFTVNNDTVLQNDVTNYEFGPELVVNGTFDSNLTGWAQVGGGSATSSNGNLRIDATGAARNVSQEVTVVPGKTYDFEAVFRSVSNGNPFYLRIFESGVGTLFEWNETTGLTNDQFLTFSFVPVGTAIDIIFRAVDTVVEWDNISLFEDIGFVTTFTPVQVNINGNISQTGNRTNIGNYTQTGDTSVSGNLTVSAQFSKSNILFNGNVLQNTGEGLRIASDPYNPLSLPQIVNAIVGGATAGDYAEQTEKNLVNFLIDNDYVDVNRSGSLTTSDYLQYLEYVANGTTGNNEFDSFIESVINEMIVIENNSPGYFNSVVFDGDYFNPNFSLQANSSGLVSFPTNNVLINNDLFVSSIVSGDINVNQDLELNEIVITDSIIEIDDNFITTTISNENLELRAQENKLIYIPTENVTLEEGLSVEGLTDVDETNINGDVSQTGNRTQTGNLTLTGILNVSSLNAQNDLQFDDIQFNNNIITTTNSNADLDLRANGVGTINIPLHNVQINNNVELGTLDSKDINISSAFSFENFELSSNVRLFDNVITTTESNSNLELRTLDSNIRIKDLFFNGNDISTITESIDISASNKLIINSNSSILLPKGNTLQRQKIDSGIRFNSEDNLFEGFKDSNTVTFGGVYSDNRRTSLTAHPTNDTLNLKVQNVNVGFVDSTGLTIHGINVDDVSVQDNILRTIVSNSDLDLKTNGIGKLVIDDISIIDNKIENNSSEPLKITNTLYGKAKFTSHSLAIPSGTTAEQPASPEVGTTRWNTDTDILEVWDGSTFITAAGSAATISQAEMDDLVLEYTLIFG